MKIPFSRLWLGAILLVAPRLAAQQEARPPVLDWLYVDTGPAAVSADLPQYPASVAKHGAHGQATVVFVVNEQGSVEQLSVAEQTDPAFAEAAMSAVARWKFTPAQQGGQLVRTRLQAPFLFASDRTVRLLISLASYGPYVGEVVREQDASSPEPVFQARPIYPNELRSQGVAGQAVLKLVVTPAGDVANVKLVSATQPAFAVSASNAVLRWKFKPARRNGQPVAVWLQVPFDFSVNDAAQ